MGLAPSDALVTLERMTDQEKQAAIEAAQAVVDQVSSYQYSAEDADMAAELDKGLAEARVSLSDDERTRILAEIDGLKDEESSSPQVRSATPVA